MSCDEAAEFVSALCDGELIAPQAARHIGECEVCRARLLEYLELGAELRRVASLESPGPAPAAVWANDASRSQSWWQRGWEKMSVPRVVFASLVVAAVGLASSLAVVGVKANAHGSVVMLSISPQPGQSYPCPLSTGNKRVAVCGLVGKAPGGMLIYKVELLSSDGNRVRLGIRSKLDSAASAGSYSLDAIKDVAERQYDFHPGESLQVEVPGFGPMTVTGEWMDHMPSVLGNEQLDPGPGELRIVSPVLLQGKEVLGDLDGGSATVAKPGQGIQIYIPGRGRFEVSSSPSQGSVAAMVKLNRISFEVDGKPYTLLAGAPITRGESAWVRYQPNYTPPNHPLMGPFIGMVEIGQSSRQ